MDEVSVTQKPPAGSAPKRGERPFYVFRTYRTGQGRALPIGLIARDLEARPPMAVAAGDGPTLLSAQGNAQLLVVHVDDEDGTIHLRLHDLDGRASGLGLGTYDLRHSQPPQRSAPTQAHPKRAEGPDLRDLPSEAMSPPPPPTLLGDHSTGEGQGSTAAGSSRAPLLDRLATVARFAHRVGMTAFDADIREAIDVIRGMTVRISELGEGRPEGRKPSNPNASA